MQYRFVELKTDSLLATIHFWQLLLRYVNSFTTRPDFIFSVQLNFTQFLECESLIANGVN